METAIIVSLGALLVSALGLLLNGRKESRQDAASGARIETKLDSIGTGVEEIRVEIRTIRSRVDALGERVSAVEASCKSAHHRLDEIKGGH